MASAVSDHTPLGDPKNGGALFTIPREIRDEIYRFLVKRHYIAFPAGKSPIECKCTICGTNTESPDLAILRVSRAIGDEAQEMVYSESLFEFLNLDFRNATSLKPPTQVVNRMKKVLVSIKGLLPETRYSVPPGIYDGTIDGLSGYRVVRDSCHVEFSIYRPNDIDPVTRRILPRLATLNGFRTILVKVYLQGFFHLYVRNGRDGYEARLEQVRQIMKDALEPTLGSPTISQDSFTISLKFHPREHLPSILRAQAQKLLLDADRVEQGD